MITAPPKGDITGGSDCYLNTHIPHSKRYQWILQDATEGGGFKYSKNLATPIGANPERARKSETEEVYKRVKKEKVTI